MFPLTKKIRLSLIDENSKLTAFTTILMLVCLLYFLSLLLLFLEWSIGVPLLFLSIGSGYLIAVLAERKKLNSYTWFYLGFILSFYAIPLLFLVAFFKSEAKLLAQETDKVKKNLLNPNENITFQQSASYLGSIKGHPEKTNYTGAI